MIFIVEIRLSEEELNLIEANWSATIAVSKVSKNTKQLAKKLALLISSL